MLLPAAMLTLDLYQAAAPCCALLWGMAMVHKFCFLLLSAPAVYAAGLSDAVNERIPVTRAELEAHWHVDCEASWAQLVSAGVREHAGANCGIANGLRGELQLCAFIYQAPGDGKGEGCPDYLGAVKLLDSAGSGNSCAAVADFLGVQPACPGLQSK